MLVTRQSPITGKINQLDLDVTVEQIKEYFGEESDRLIQEIFTNLSPDEREFIKTGILPGEVT
jgi:hypothetical protein